MSLLSSVSSFDILSVIFPINRVENWNFIVKDSSPELAVTDLVGTSDWEPWEISLTFDYSNDGRGHTPNEKEGAQPQGVRLLIKSEDFINRVS